MAKVCQFSYGELSGQGRDEWRCWYVLPSLHLSLCCSAYDPAYILGFALGGFFSLMSATFAYEDPLSRASEKLVGTKAQTIYIFKEMGRNMWSSGKGFAKVGALYSGYECCIEGVSSNIIDFRTCASSDTNIFIATQC
jgi:hypothetical protein